MQNWKYFQKGRDSVSPIWYLCWCMASYSLSLFFVLPEFYAFSLAEDQFLPFSGIPALVFYNFEFSKNSVNEFSNPVDPKVISCSLLVWYKQHLISLGGCDVTLLLALLMGSYDLGIVYAQSLYFLTWFCLRKTSYRKIIILMGKTHLVPIFKMVARSRTSSQNTAYSKVWMCVKVQINQ